MIESRKKPRCRSCHHYNMDTCKTALSGKQLVNGLKCEQYGEKVSETLTMLDDRFIIVRYSTTSSDDKPTSGLLKYKGKRWYEFDVVNVKHTGVFTMGKELTFWEIIEWFLNIWLFEFCIGKQNSYKNGIKGPAFKYRKPRWFYIPLYKIYYGLMLSAERHYYRK